MGYYVYHSKGDSEAKIHYAACPHCNHGFGQQREADPPNGEWLGPFGSYHAAEAAAAKTAAALSDCANCSLQ